MTIQPKNSPKNNIRYFANIASWVDELRIMGKDIEDPEKRQAFKETANIILNTLIKMDRDFTVVPKAKK